jgi:actin related protein 2/3 complex subunit 5
MEVLQSIRQADMSPVLGRIYKGEGGSEALDTLMKYMYVNLCCISPLGAHWARGKLTAARYKGMAQAAPAGSKHASPQSTGFSQMQGRQLGGGEGAGHGMSVLLSWHEKVCPHVVWRLF